MYLQKLFISFACVLISLSAGQAAMAQDNSSAGMAHAKRSAADTAFVQQAAKGGIAEVELSQLATTSATTPEVREFAQKMVDDHSANNRELAAAASKLGISVPKETDQEHMRLHQKLSGIRGAGFDKAYIDAMCDDHQKMVDLLQSSSKSVTAPELRAYIDKTLPVVREHLAMAQKLRK